ncbi:PEPxxWA-CTERM sorting domain-containing protein [[Empedobacter] haloabium]|uniref:PEPxxWA-CTERM sorting domain-containing protein n=1 Tax=[Empedobacter] haloabium TaxID=592317 RepID=A0ABZ1ULI1_9BURK
MKTKILGLALAMAAMTPMAHADHFPQFDFAVAGPNGSQEWLLSSAVSGPNGSPDWLFSSAASGPNGSQSWATAGSGHEFNEDGGRANVIDGAYDVVENQYGNDSGFRTVPLAGRDVMLVPEPTTWAMLLAGVGILGVVARRRKTAA